MVEHNLPYKILVVDDEPDLELLITQKYRKKIRSQEFEFTFAENGVDALRKLESNGEMDIVLTDINMPEMDGLTLLTNLKDNYPLLKSVIVSAYGDMSNIRTALNRGAFDFLTKPIDFQDLEITIDKTLQEAVALKQAIRDRDKLIAIKQELDVARTIQQSIVPDTFPAFPDRTDIDLYATMIPANEVGGDLYDFFLIDDDRLGFVIGDVSGKGVPAAIFMAVSRTLLKATALNGLAPDECIKQVNSLICSESLASIFVTIFYGILDTRSGDLAYCSGGHNPPLILKENEGVESLDVSGGLVLGAMKDFDYHTKKTKLEPGDLVLLYTDGITEAMNRKNEEYGDTRLIDCIKKLRDKKLQEIVNIIVSSVKEFTDGAPQSDDLTILALQFKG